MVTTKGRYTVEELEHICDSKHRYDLIRGEIVKMAPAGGYHGKIAANVIGYLWWHASNEGLGDVYTSETGFVLARDPDVLLAPDAAFITQARVPTDQQGFYEIAPDLAVEVVSPNDSATHIQQKVAEYLAAGVRLVWIIYPESKTISVYDNAGTVRFLGTDHQLDGGDVLPGFGVPVAEIFA